jgi:hypothetical protein
MGLPALAGAWGRYIGFCLGKSWKMPYLDKSKSKKAGKNICGL